MRLVVAMAGVVLVGVVAALAVGRINDAERYRLLMAAGDQALSTGNSYAAIEAFSGAVALRADSMASHLRRGLAYQNQRRYDEAARDFREAVRLQPGAIDPLLALATLHETRGDTAGAADWYAQAAAIDRQSPTLLYRLALARYRSGQAAGAAEPLRQAITLDGGFDEALYLLGVVLRDVNDPAGAVEALERAIRANPSLAPAREELADLYHALRRSGDEMAQLTALATQAPAPEREIAIALAQAGRGEFDAAEATLASAQGRTGDESQLALAVGRVRVWRAEALPAPGPRAAAAAHALAPLERALGGTVRRSEGLALFGRALHLQGNHEEAARILREAASTSPFSRDAYRYLADAHEALGDAAEARLWLTRYDALAGDVDRPARLRKLGGLSVALGDFRPARDYLDPLVTADTADPQLLGWLAEARWHTGDADGARQLLDRALTLAPRDAGLRRLRQTMR